MTSVAKGRAHWAICAVLVGALHAGSLAADVAVTPASADGVVVNTSPAGVGCDVQATIAVNASAPPQVGQQTLVSEALTYEYTWSFSPDGSIGSVNPSQNQQPSSQSNSSATGSFPTSGQKTISVSVTIGGTADYSWVDADGNTQTATLGVSGSTPFQIDVDIVGVQHLEYRIGDAPYQPVLDVLRVCRDTTVDFRAESDPPASAWPTGRPVWSASSGASVLPPGTGGTASVVFGATSGTSTEYKTVTCSCCDVQATANVLVVDIQGLQYSRDGTQWENVTGAIYVAKDMSLHFRAVSDPAGAAWPQGMPTWGGNVGLSDTDVDMVSVTFDTASDSPTDYSTVTATCDATIMANVLVAEVQLKTKRYGSNEWDTTLTRIASGGKASGVHKAAVQIRVPSGLGAQHPLEVSLTGDGGGHTFSSWWSTKPAAKAKLAFGSTTAFVHGDASPLSFTSPPTLNGWLTSSNKLESTTILVAVPTLGITCTADVDFVLGDFVVDLGDDPIPVDQWHDFTVSMSLDGVPIDGHEVNLVVWQVILEDGTPVDAALGSGSGSSTSLANYVQLDPGALFNHDYFQATTGTTLPSVATQLKLKNSSVATLTIKAYDMSVKE